MKAGGRRRRRGSDAAGWVLAVTGVHGSFPTRLLRRLDEDNRVARIVLLDRKPVLAPLMKAASYRVDLIEPNADGHIAEILQKESVSSVVHLAYHTKPHGDPSLAHDLEAVGTMHLIGAVAQATGVGRPLRHLLVVGSDWVYGAHPQNPAVLTENEPLRGCPGYSFVDGKVDAERQLESARPRIPIPITVLRASPILNPGGDGVMSSYLSRLIVPTIWGYDPMVQLLHGEDLVEVCRVALERRPNATYNVAGSGALPLRTLLRLLGRGEIQLLATVAPKLLDLLWASGLSPVPGAHAPYLRYSLVLDVGRAARDLGFRPRRSTLETLEHFAGRRLDRAA